MTCRGPGSDACDVHSGADGGCLFWRTRGADLLAEVRKREKALGVEPDWAVDALMRASAVQGAPSRSPYLPAAFQDMHTC